MTRKLITPAVLAQKPPASGRMETKDTLSPLAFRITAAGARAFTVRVRIKGQTQPIRLTFEKPPHPSTLTEAREWAVRMTSACRQGTDPREEARAAKAAAEATKVDAEQNRFEVVAERFLATNGAFKKNSRPWKPRTKDEYDRNLKRPIARWRGRNIQSITRDEISDYLAEVAEDAPIAANRLLAVLSAMMNWWQTQRGSNFTNPIIRGMAPAEERSRDRILSDDELRVVWRIAERNGTYGGIVRMLLLTGARKSEVAAMRHSMIKDGVWELPGTLTKNHEQLSLPLSKTALKLIEDQSRMDGQDLVFTLNGKREFHNWGKSKAELDLRCLRRLFDIETFKRETEEQIELVKGFNPEATKPPTFRFRSKSHLVAARDYPKYASTRDRTFHLDHYCFDSQPEFDFFHKVLDLDEGDKIYFTGIHLERAVFANHNRHENRANVDVIDVCHRSK